MSGNRIVDIAVTNFDEKKSRIKCALNSGEENIFN